MEWSREKNNCLTQVAGFVPDTRESVISDPVVLRAGIMQSLPNYKATVCRFGNDHTLCFVTQGRGWLKLDGKTLELAVGDVFCIFPDSPVSYGTSPASLLHKSWVGFSSARAAAIVSELGLCAAHPVIHFGPAIHTYLPILNEIRMELFRRTPGFTWRATGLLWQLLGSMAKSRRQSAPSSPRATELIRQVVHYIEMHYADISRISDVSKYIGLSRSHFATLFKQEMGVSALDFLIETRLKRAEDLLLHTSHSIKIIAMSVGFQDRAYFSRLFTSRRGISPQKFREARM